MYASFSPRIGVLHFTLAIVFFPFGAPQAQPVPARVRPSISQTIPAATPRAAARGSRGIGICIAHNR